MWSVRWGDNVGGGGGGLRGVPRVLGVGLGRGRVGGRGVAVRGGGSGRGLRGWRVPARVARVASSTWDKSDGKLNEED